MANKVVNVAELSKKQKINYVKNTLFNNEINEALDILLKDEKKDLEISKIIIDVLNENIMIKRIKQQCDQKDFKSAKLFVYSKMLGVLSFYNKTVIINAFLRLFDEEDAKDIAIYEYQNMTTFSVENVTFNKRFGKYKKEALDTVMIDETDQEKLDKGKEKYNKTVKENRKAKLLVIIISTIGLLLLVILSYLIYTYNAKIKIYDNKIYKGIYLDDINLSGKNISKIDSIVNDEKEKILNGTLTVENINGTNDYSYKDIGVEIDSDTVISNIKKYNKNLSIIDKYINIYKKKNKTFYLKGSISDEKVNEFTELLKNTLNTIPVDDGLVIDDNHNVTYNKGSNGFTLNEDETKNIIIKRLSNLTSNTVIKVTGKVVKNEVKNESLKTVNTKVTSYTTYFANSGNRGHNINLACRRLNGSVIMPGETFSYFKASGPFGASNGYLPAPVYLNSEVKTENGGGVCQLASTLYNATLRAGLETVARRSHTFAPNYVPKGLDATVYGTTVDFKVKNNYKYPMYIVSYVKGNYLTVDIWTNDEALGGLTYEPYSVASRGGYAAYLNVIRDGKVIETKYLDWSTYKVHP